MNDMFVEAEQEHYVMRFNDLDLHLVKNNETFDALSAQGLLVFTGDELNCLKTIKDGMLADEWRFALQRVLDLKSVFPSAKISDARSPICLANQDQKFEIDKKLSKKWENSLGIQFTQIPAGEFEMGIDGDKYASPRHLVQISKPFYLSLRPVSMYEFELVTGYISGRTENIKDPVDMVSYNDVMVFIDLLNQQENKQYRLPTEAEWEYACLAAGVDMEAESSNPTPTKNKFGLWMMQDSCEWVSDWWGPFSAAGVTDPTGPEDGRYRVFRCGGTKKRNGAPPDKKIPRLGFRLACS